MGLLGWALLFFVVALIAALFGFTGIAAGAASIARVLFFLFLLVFLCLFTLEMLGSCSRAVERAASAEVSAGIA